MIESKANVMEYAIQARRLGISFGVAPNRTEAVRGLDLGIAPGEFVSVLGPSGCGKSTLLSALAGLRLPTEGELWINSERIRGPGTDRGMVFQHPTLFPWKTVFGNVEFGLRRPRLTRLEKAAAVNEILEQVGLTEFAHHYPAQLSGGMQQRVNLARALVNRPRVLLMDEPFAALDAQTRFFMQELLLEIWDGQRMTVVFVTHDVDEALFLADRVVVLSRRPAQLRADIKVDLERPRTTEILTDPRFTRLKKQSLEILRSEVDRAAKRTPPTAEGVLVTMPEDVTEQASVS